MATHNRAGEITYVQIGDLTIRVTVTTYTKTSSIAADRDSLEIFWGDGTSRWVRRTNGNGQPLDNDVKYNIYVAEHTYPGRATYTISITDPNRNGGILNVNPPNSENIQFHLETTFTFLNPQFQGYNSSPVLLQPPVDVGCVGQRFIHNPNAYDPDGDSLAYELVVPMAARGIDVPNYSFPNQISPGPNNIISLNPLTGDFIWTSPQRPGEYNITILIKEFRQGLLINTTRRDMQILIQECDNRPPVIETIEEICVVAGEIIDLSVTATDPDINPIQRVRLSALGGPFEQEISPAVFDVAAGYQNQPLTGRFIWQTTCEHISDRYYVVIFRAEDNALGNGNFGLSTLKSVRIKVSGPPPENTEIQVTFDEEILLTWDFPYECLFTENNYFRGFSVWRRNSSNPFEPDTCSPSMAGKGYTSVAFALKQDNGESHFYLDTDIEKGKTYCYRIVPEFARLSITGNPFNLVEGIPSDEVCIQLARDVPIVTRVSIEETSVDNGVIEVKWSKPLVPELDTLENPGPYEYRVLRRTGIGIDNFEQIPGAIFSSPDFSSANDTIFVDDFNLNTLDNPYTYLIDFYVNGNVRYGNTNPASSVYLNIISTDRRNILNWDFRVPWENLSYEIYRKSPGETDFNLITEVKAGPYIDRGLINEQEYCYYIRAIGTYGIPKIEDPLLNKSQEICGIPIDTVPPCPPPLTVTNDCELADETSGEGSFQNKLTWFHPVEICEESDDTDGYRIYYAGPGSNNFELIAEITNPNTTEFFHRSEFGLAGCYVITAFDREGNESEFSQVRCMDNCPNYRLPNTFTPNGDGFNDLFTPKTSRFINRVIFKVFNVWGNLVFETTDPMINWDGRDKGGQDLAEGTYYYTCEVFEERLEGVIQTNNLLNGYIELIR
jgi:gliding motility-associated-like protein